MTNNELTVLGLLICARQRDTTWQCFKRGRCPRRSVPDQWPAVTEIGWACRSIKVLVPSGLASVTWTVRNAPTSEHAAGRVLRCSYTITTTPVADSTASAG